MREQDQIRLSVGDRLPAIELVGGNGQPIEFGEHSLLGRPVALWITDTPDPISALAFVQRLPEFVEVGALAFVVVSGAAPEPPGLPPEVSERVLVDRDGGLARTAGLDRGGIVVFDADFRLVAIHNGANFTPALDDCARIFRRTAPVVVRGAAPVLMIRDVIEPELRHRLIEYWAAGEKMVDAVTRETGRVVASRGAKKRTDVEIRDPDLEAMVRDRIRVRVVPEMHKAFNFTVAQYQRFQIGCYDSALGGRFARHRDNRNRHSAHRQFAISVNLNVGEYEGGQLVFPEYGRQLYEPEAGGAVVFSCSVLHEALAVISGRRFGLFSFFFDAAAARLDDEARAAAAVTG